MLYLLKHILYMTLIEYTSPPSMGSNTIFLMSHFSKIVTIQIRSDPSHDFFSILDISADIFWEYKIYDRELIELIFFHLLIDKAQSRQEGTKHKRFYKFCQFNVWFNVISNWQKCLAGFDFQEAITKELQIYFWKTQIISAIHTKNSLYFSVAVAT